MSAPRFASAAERLAGMAGVALGWRPAEFWNSTPAELQTIFQMLVGESDAETRAGGSDLARLMEMFPDG